MLSKNWLLFLLLFFSSTLDWSSCGGRGDFDFEVKLLGRVGVTSVILLISVSKCSLSLWVNCVGGGGSGAGGRGRANKWDGERARDVEFLFVLFVCEWEKLHEEDEEDWADADEDEDDGEEEDEQEEDEENDGGEWSFCIAFEWLFGIEEAAIFKLKLFMSLYI